MRAERPRYAAPSARRRWPLWVGGLVLGGGAATPLDAAAAAGAAVLVVGRYVGDDGYGTLVRRGARVR